jgi:hypothetical protein
MTSFKELKEALDDFIQKSFESYNNHSKIEREILVIDAVDNLAQNAFISAREREKGLSEDGLTEIKKQIDQFIEKYFIKKFTELSLREKTPLYP